MTKHVQHAAVVGLVSALSLIACRTPTDTAREPDDYFLVQSYDARSNQWTVVHRGTWDGQRQSRRYLLECMSSKTDQDQQIERVCALTVGARMVSASYKHLAELEQSKTLWWASENRRPLFVFENVDIGILSVEEDDKNIRGKRVSLNTFHIVKADLESEK